jgi:hypothetical protein
MKLKIIPLIFFYFILLLGPAASKGESVDPKKIYYNLNYGPTNFTLNNFLIYDKKRFKNLFKYNEKYFGFYISESKTYCILEHDYSFNNANITLGRFNNLICSTQKLSSSNNKIEKLFTVKRGATLISNGSGGYLRIFGKNNFGEKFLITADHVDFFGDIE